MSIDRKIENILQIGDYKEQIVKFNDLIDEVISSNPTNIVAYLKSIGNKLLSDEVQQQITRNCIVHLAKAITSIESESLFEIASSLITAIKENIASYDEADYILRESLFSYYINSEQFSDAAQILSGTNLESTTRPFSDKEKVDIHVKCAETFLEDDASIDAETFVNKASAIINGVDDLAIQLRYRVTYARVLDANRKFIEAAIRYYELSTTTAANVVQEDLLQLLGKAVTCIILGKSGVQRSRVMGLLYKDERLHSLDQLSSYSSHSTVLSKMLKDQILKKDELQAFESCLMPHQKATTSDGFSLLEKAIVEHNMLALGKIYDNIKFSEIAKILSLDQYKAEKISATMIIENRLSASIDQTEGILEFSSKETLLTAWDDTIKEICDEITEFVDISQQVYLDKLIT